MVICIQGEEEHKLRDVCEVTDRKPSNPLESDIQCVCYKSTGFTVCSSVFLASVQSSLHICPFQSIAMGRAILCHCMLERNNLLSDFAICDFQDFALSVRRDLRHLNSVGVPTDYYDHCRLKAFSSQDEEESVVSKV